MSAFKVPPPRRKKRTHHLERNPGRKSKGKPGTKLWEETERKAQQRSELPLRSWDAVHDPAHIPPPQARWAEERHVTLSSDPPETMSYAGAASEELEEGSARAWGLCSGGAWSCALVW